MLSGLLFAFTLHATAASAPKIVQKDPRADSPAQHAKRMSWFRDARFGMFIHWGLYSVPAGYWNGQEVPGAAEWLQYTAKVKPEDYEPLQQQFNPVNFDAKKWVQIAKSAGMKYIVITSKHHEGFGMWPSKQGTWNIGHTQFHRDPLKELAQACKEGGIKLCFYHSIMDWHEPDYLPRRTWDTRDASHASMDRYVAYMKAQLKELLTNYGPIGILWFDGQWEDTWTHERGKDLYYYVRSLQPNIIINNRVDTGRANGGMTVKNSDFVGDYGTPEQTIPANGIPGTDWESCMTMNDTWGYSAHDHNWKSSTTLIRNLVDCASKGGNYLLNVGPTSLGEIPDASIERLAEVGDWMKKYSGSIYGSAAGPFPKALGWGKVTQKPGKLFLHVFDHSAKSIDLPGLKANIKGIHVLGQAASETIPFHEDANGVNVILPKMADEADTVLELDYTGSMAVSENLIQPSADGSIHLKALDADVNGSSAQYESDKDSIGFWTNPKETVSWTFNARRAGTYEVGIEVACEDASQGSTFEVDLEGHKLTGVVPATGTWSKFTKLDLGSVTINTPGKTVITVKPTKLAGYAVMNLRDVTLTPR